MKYLPLLTLLLISCVAKKTDIVVFQSDFGLENNAVASMYGVSAQVDPTLKMYNLSHDIPEYDVWYASLNLTGVIEYWPQGTIFVSVVDPGVGTARYSVVAKTKTGHYIVTPDNGTLTFIHEKYGIEELREIDEAVNRRADSDKSYTFHGRDVYAYTAARLASKTISFEQVGQKLDPTPVLLNYTPAQKVNQKLEGTIVLLDSPYGNVWSNIDRELFLSEGIQIGDRIDVRVSYNNREIYKGQLLYVATFGNVREGESLVYINSSYEVSLAINMGNFAEQYKIGYGEGWKLEVSKALN
ncbi:MAG: SAM hydrolase/SAM-dependent halogenase family protein [Brevinema sp.]